MSEEAKPGHSKGDEFTVPSGFDKLSYEDKVDIMSGLNSGEQIRKEIDNILGVEHEGDSFHFNSEDLARLLLALGGPQ